MARVRQSNQYTAPQGGAPLPQRGNLEDVAGSLVNEVDLEAVAWAFSPEAERWRALGFSFEQATAWSDLCSGSGSPVADAEAWVQEGFDLWQQSVKPRERAFAGPQLPMGAVEAMAWRHRHEDYSPADAYAWRYRGFSVAEADEWSPRWLTASAAAIARKDHGDHGSAIAAWEEAGFSDTERIVWSTTGSFTLRHAAEWKRALMASDEFHDNPPVKFERYAGWLIDEHDKPRRARSEFVAEIIERIKQTGMTAAR